MKERTEALSILLINLFYPERHPTIGFPVNVESLAGDLAAEFGDSVDVSVLDMQQPGVTVDKILRTVRDKHFDVVGVSVKTGQREIAESILDGVLDLPIQHQPRYLMVGGYRPRVYHEEFAEKYPDPKVVVCIGEGEPTMRGMVSHLRGGIPITEVPNLVFMTSQGLQRTVRRQHDLTTWHSPGTSTLPLILEAGGVVYLETSRGCSWGKCTFCSRKFSSGTKPSTIPPEKIAQSWAEFRRLGVQEVYCSDEDFMMNSHAHGRALGEALIEANVQMRFWVQTTVDGVLQLGRASYTADNDGTAGRRLPMLDIEAPLVGVDPVGRFDGKGTLAILRKAGLSRIFFGLESGSASQLIRYRKGVTASEGARAVQLCREVGFEVEVGFIPLDPLVTTDELRETVEYIRAHNLAQSTVKILNLMCVQNGVAMFAQTKEAGLITGERDVDTFLYPYAFANPRAGQIAEWVHQWQRHGLSEFTYALRRVVDADPSHPISTQFLFELRQLEFEFLAMLVEQNPEKDETTYDQCMQRRFNIMQRCMNAVANEWMPDPTNFLAKAFEESKAWMQESETADVLRL